VANKTRTEMSLRASNPLSSAATTPPYDQPPRQTSRIVDEEDEDAEYDDDDGVMRLSDLLNKKASNKTNFKKDNNDNDNENNNSDNDDYNSNDDDDDDDDGDDDDLENVHERLLSAIEKFANDKDNNKTKNDKNKGKTLSNSNQSAPESAYSSSYNEAVSMDALLSALDESQSLKSIKHKLTELEKSMNKTSTKDLSVPIYVNKVVSDRIERKVSYDKNKDEMNKWTNIVNENRALKTLDLARDKRQSTSYRTLLKKFIPENDMEREVQMALYDTGTDDKGALAKEEDDLGHRTTDINELRQKQADLAKVKALLFYDQMKRHRLNKIKSKAYHRIKKRQRMRNAEKDNEIDILSDQDNVGKENKEALKRVEERMNLRHKNMGKWARMALEHSHTNKG
jgi:U3 small nucleolar RNA-associated protein 14